MFEGLRQLGVGINYRPEFGQTILDYKEGIDFLEIITERFFNQSELKFLEELTSTFPLVCHGLDLSIGSLEPLNDEYLTKLGEILNRFNPVWFSEHLSMTHIDKIDIGHLTPVVFTEEIIEMVCQKIKVLQRKTSLPFLLENITYYFPIPGAEMTEGEFFAKILERSNCGMLLDLNNLVINAKNHGYDLYDFLNVIPLNRVVEIHLGGAIFQDGLYVDTHGHPVSEEVWECLEFVCRHVSIRGIVLERDQNFLPFEELLSELQRARKILVEFGK